jgi:hypothetical protein
MTIADEAVRRFSWSVRKLRPVAHDAFLLEAEIRQSGLLELILAEARMIQRERRT